MLLNLMKVDKGWSFV